MYMNKKSMKTVLFLSAVLSLRSAVCFAQNISSAELINNAKIYDGKQVQYQGELVGEAMARGQHVWLNLNDGINALGVWAEKGALENIRFAGNYHNSGDMIQVTGILHRSCLEHGGDFDIHAAALKIIGSGKEKTEVLSQAKVIWAGILAVMLWLVMMARYFGPRQV